MRRPLSAAVALLLLAPAASAQINKALDLVPDDALGFVLIKDLRGLSDNVEQVAKKLDVAERVSLLELIQQQVGIREGLNDKGSALFIVFRGKNEETMFNAIFAVAISDYAKVASQLGVKEPKEGINQGEMGAVSGLLAGIGGRPDQETKKSPVLVARRGDFVLLALPDHREALEKIVSAKKSIAASLQPATDWLEEQDISGVCTHHGVKVGLGMFMGGPGGAAQSTTPGQAARIKEMYADVEKNLKLVAFGGRIEKAGHWRLLTRAYFEPEGPYAKWIAEAQPADGTLLAQLPDQPYALAALARRSAQTTFEGALRLATSNLPSEAGDKVTKSALKLIERISEVGVGVYADPRDKKVSEGDFNVLARVDDAPGFVAAAVELLNQIGEATQAKEPVTLERLQLAGKSSRLIRFSKKIELKEDLKEPGPLGTIGGGTFAGLLLTEMDAKTVLVALPKDAAHAEATVKKLSAGAPRPLAKNQELLKTTALLPDKVQAAVYFNIDSWLRVVGVSAPGAVPLHCPPLGFALRSVPAGIEAQFVLPFESIHAVSKTWKAQEKREGKEKE